MSVRRLCVIMVAVLVAGFLVPVHELLLPKWAEAATACSPNSDDWSNGRSGEKRCVFNHKYSTRRRINEACLRDRPVFGTHIYQQPSECSPSGGVEAIGQARAIKYLSDQIGGGGGLINPAIQWEPSLSGGSDRPDIIYYDRVGNSWGQVIEAKVSDNADYSGWGGQVARYVTALSNDGVRNVTAGTVLNQYGAYDDWFQVYSKNRSCKVGDKDGYQLSTYRATAPVPGLLRIDEVRKERKCEESKRQPPPGSPPTEIPEWDENDDDRDWPIWQGLRQLLDRLTTPRGDSSSENNNDVARYGSTAAAAAALTAALVAFFKSPRGLLFLRAAGFASAEAALALGASTLIVLILLWYFSEHGGLVKGEPHFTTLDGLGYDLQSVGEFVLAASDRYGLEVHGRLSPASGGRDVSVMFDAAMEAGDHKVEFHENDLYLDGQKFTLDTDKILYLGKDAFVLRKDGKWLVMFDGLDGPVLSWRRGAAGLYLPPSADSDLVGLLGNADGDPKNDLKLRDGTQLPATATPAQLHTDYANSWRLDDTESLFTYGPGESTATFTDLQFPSRVVTIHDLTPEQMQLASAQCEASGVQPGVPFNDCVLDMALTADTSFAAAAAEQKTVSIDPAAQVVNDNGDLTVDFEGTLGKNVLPSRVSADASAGSFAGPFSGDDSYRFFVQSLPPHKSGSLAFDLLAVGDWSADSDTETVKVETDRDDPRTVTPGELTPVASGTLANGLPWTKYRVTVPVTHSNSQIEVKVSVTGAAGISGQAYGLDNVTLDLDVAPPQTFAVPLPFTASDGVPGEGAGNLEGEVAVDEYRFTLDRPASLFVNAQECPGFGLRWELLDAAGAKAATNNLCGAKRVDGLAAGAYRLRVSPWNDAFGPYKLSVNTLGADVVATAAIDGPQVPIQVADPGQRGTWTFTGTAGQKVSAVLGEGTLSSLGDATVQLRGPDGRILAQESCGKECFVDTETLPATGTYAMVWDPKDAQTGSIALRLHAVPAAVTGTVAIGAPATLTTSVPGQTASWSFAGTQGQRVAFAVSGLAGAASASISNPDGTRLFGSTYCPKSCAFDTVTLPATGTYTLLVDPSDLHTGPITASVAEGDVTGTLTAGGGPVKLTTTAPGQRAYWTFAGQTGQRVAFALTDGTFSGAYASVRKPDGTDLFRSTWCKTSCAFDPVALPADGTYTLVVDPSQTAIGSITAQVTEGDATGTLTAGGEPVKLTTTGPGQVAVWSFAGTAGQRVAFGLSEGTFGSAYALVRKPDGTELHESAFCKTSCAFDTVTLPANGVYTVVLDPSGTSVGSMTAQVTVGDITAALTADGPAVKLTTKGPGQYPVWTYAGKAGQRVSVTFSGGTFTSANASMRKPDGSVLVPSVFCATSCYFDTTVLPADGEYQVVVDPAGIQTGSVSAALNLVPPDVTAQISVGGPAATLTTTIPGQRGLWTFAGTAGQRVSFDLTGSTFTYASDATVKVRRPDGADLVAETNCGTGCLLEPVTLPATGTYTVDLRPKGSKTGALTLRAYQVDDVSATIAIDGPVSRLTTTVPGQNGRWTFSGTQGQYVNIAFLDGTFSLASDAAVSVLGPDGAVLRQDTSCGKVCMLDPVTLPATGTYTILFDPRKALAGALSAQLTEGDVTAATSIGGPASTLTTVGAGQKAVWSFTGAAGRRVSFNFTASTLTSLYDAYVAVRKPDGGVLVDDTPCGKNCLLEPVVLPAAGVYTVEFRPQNAKTGAITLQLHEVTHLAANVTVGGAASTLTTTTPGQNGVWSFTGTAGQRVSFNLTDASFTSSTYARVSVKQPDGTVLVAPAYCGRNCFLEPVALPVSGTYTVEFDPQDEKTGKLTLRAYRVTDLAPAAVTVGGAASTLTTTTPGQNGSWTFTGTAGQKVAVAFTGATFAASADVRVSLVKPDGTALGSSPYCGRNCTIAATTLPDAGTYTIVLNPQNDKTGSLTAKVTTAS
ncbi:VWD domain-containing protein [Actinomadura sp. ATCC 31491]|uniref:VWD domain-containing protein n=1 Tax=Actinomadura luzonensis TaxID=2805427 RepID=A0ABT0G1J2_9ACTN|nr:VWD domain-containing protein [Actinomadura luzonensis]MCK2218399.1 VWD domain-containing protein [Actinomadura luzonensis]